MDNQRFCEARESFLNHRRPFNDPEEHQAMIAAIEAAAAPEHVWENVGTGVFDQAQCSCGWIGKNFWDRSDLAAEDWRGHVAKAALAK